MAYGDPPGSFPWPKGLPPIWTEYPSLTFRPEEWRMPVVPKWVREAKVRDSVSYQPLEQAMSELDREDEIMSAVRAVARGG